MLHHVRLFILEDEKEQHLCFNWKNCRPLEKSENMSKSNKIKIFDILMQQLRVKYYLQHIQIAGTS